MQGHTVAAAAAAFFLTGPVRVFDDRWCESGANSVPPLSFVTSRNSVEKLLQLYSLFYKKHPLSS